jgi:hypothetical protein
MMAKDKNGRERTKKDVMDVAKMKLTACLREQGDLSF